MTFLWQPPNLFELCPAHTNLSACSPFGLMYLHLLVKLFGSAPDYPEPALMDGETYDFIVVGAGAAGATMTFVWQPPNLFELCPAHSNLSACSPFGLMYLDLLVKLFGSAPDYPKPALVDGETYDFIVVGAGAAGCVVANRLSAVKEFKVLLLEVGPEEPDITQVVGLTGALANSNVDWQYKTMPSNLACLAFPDRRCRWPRGKVMGGSSSINWMVYVRGNQLDYDGWARRGNPGWSYQEVLPFFKKAENNLNIEALDRKYHGVNGPQPVSRFPYVDDPSIMVTEAFIERGVPLSDVNDGIQFGTEQSQATSKEGQKASTNWAYIRPIRFKRRNLTIRTEAYVIRILFDENKRATGVKYIKNGQAYTAYATKEVIVSGGVINSPQLLMLSGIGPREHLEDLRIPVIADLPVGENLHDHVTFNALVVALPNKTATTVSQQTIVEDTIQYKQMKVKRGPLSGNGPTNSLSMWLTNPNLPAPDMQMQPNNILWQEYIREPAAANDVTIFPSAFYNGLMPRVMNNVPKSRGRLLLNASDPHGHPLIWSGYYSDPADLELLIKGVRQCLDIENTKAFKSRGAYFVRTPLPACRHFTWGTDEYFECLARSYTTSAYHPVGTCKMGPSDDPTAVIDPRLRVYGVSRLRVIDASIMPQVVRGNTNAASIMIGERGVAFVLEEWPPNLYELCPAYTNLTACTPFALMYLDLLVKLFGSAPDHAPAPNDGETYDFIVVGAGAAGCVVANRLSAIKEWRVLLLEAGPEEPDITSVPGLSTALLNSNIDWQYKTMPSPVACLNETEEPDITSVLALSTVLLNYNIAWQYMTMPNSVACLASENQQCRYGRG
ncbi:glucose dehydrogenase [FAD, quinone]-like [Cydia strobilella]|uniref:glucose dehydrogenase [FAD, quinone]-like n=1 Tax=Cydia strobilella TaxID=1100964 RepID=UPI003004971C